jgi:ABC-type multidrug transport system ATPase subunit
VQDLKHAFSPEGRALDNLNFSVSRGEMLCIIGPSGSGKSTLLATLSGQLRPHGGTVRLNGIDLYSHRGRLAPCIAYMPQEEALNPQLTVREHLRHASTIRRPHLPPPEQERRVDGLLVELGLQPLARRRVGAPGEKTISGGERSRLNLGLDLSSAAEVFLFDEPISGLSSKDSEHVAQTLRSLARDKIIVTSLHRPGAQVLHLFDKVLLLDSGGRIAFFGSPRAMIDYFREACQDLQIAHPVANGANPTGADFVFDVLETPLHQIGGGQNPAAARRFPATFWQERFEALALSHAVDSPCSVPPSRISEDGRASDDLPVPRPRKPTLRELAPLWATHFHRSLLSKRRNRGTIYSTLIEAPLLAALVGLTLRSSPEGSYDFSTALHLPAYLFLSATVAMFLGLTNSATEILRDRPTLRRERNCHPVAWLYVTAKFAALALVAGAQCAAYLAVGNLLIGIRGLALEHWFWLTLTSCTGTAMALLVSSLVRSERAALTSVPLLLVPQMLLAGALVPFPEMNRALFEDSAINRERGGTPVPAVVMPLRYAYEAMVVTQATRNPFELQRQRIQRRIDLARDRDTELSPAVAERFDILKAALTRLLGSGADNPQDARRLVRRLGTLARSGTRIEVETLEVWPDDAPDARPCSEFFVNNRIDLMVRQAESYRTDYRNKEPRNVFLAEQKYLGDSEVGTLEATATALAGTSLVCLLATVLTLRIQSRRVA